MKEIGEIRGAGVANMETKHLVQAVALFSGFPVYWTIYPEKEIASYHADAVAKLIEWMISWPQATLGVDLLGLHQILYTIYMFHGEKVKASELLNKMNIPIDIESSMLRIACSKDGEVFSSRSDMERMEYLSQKAKSAKSDSYRVSTVWLTGEDARWWIQKIRHAFQSYAELLVGETKDGDLFELFQRYRCTVFAPVNVDYIHSEFKRLMEIVEAEEARKQILDLLNELAKMPKQLFSGLFLSWRLVNFSKVEDNLVYQPMLALWNYWPVHDRWAPPVNDKSALERGPLSPKIASELLEKVMLKLWLLLAVARDHYGLGVTAPEFSGRQVMPPVFYYVAPKELPKQGEEYLNNYSSLLYPVAKTCLGTDDPFAHEVGWGKFEGNLLVLRREQVVSDRVHTWYLLMPFTPWTSNDEVKANAVRRELEQDIDFVVDKFSFLEFSIGRESQQIYRDIARLGLKYATYTGSFRVLLSQLDELLVVAEEAKPVIQDQVYYEVIKLRTIVSKLRMRIESAAEESRKVKSKYEGYLDATEDFFRRAFTYSPVVSHGIRVRDLKEAMLDTYPYHYLKDPVHQLEKQKDSALYEIQEVLEGVTGVMEGLQHWERESQRAWLRALNVLAGFLVFLIALPQFMPGSVLTPENVPDWIRGIISIPTLEYFIRNLTIVSFIILIILIFVFLGYRLSRRYLFKAKDYIMHRINRLWHQVVKEALSIVEQIFELEKVSGEIYGLEYFEKVIAGILSGEKRQLEEKLEYLDEEGSRFLCEIFDSLKKLIPAKRDLSQRRDIDIIRKMRYLRYLIALIDLRPEIIPLPRTLCLFHFKVTDFQLKSNISDKDFIASLRVAGFSREEAEKLYNWLSGIKGQIQKLDCRDFLELLEKKGVTAIGEKRQSEQWTNFVLGDTQPT